MRAMVAAVLLFGLSGPAQALMCPASDDGFDMQSGTVFPGFPGYDPDTYGRLIYDQFKWAFDSMNRVVLIGTLSPRWSDDQPLMHQAIADHQRQVKDAFNANRPADGDFDAASASVDFSYRGALWFSGSEVSIAGNTPLPDQPFDFLFHVYEEDYPQSDPIWDVPKIFVANSFQSMAKAIEVESLGGCATTFPAPDDAALQTLTACIVNNGCD